ncbi:MAG TPA: choice-of-anchor D domain-containing protein, partial [Candidatus Sumerlaeota bacterium]|nr:choice-of-anchor D domain-containing protein [Candidatus Sumerlaeota bacterium]
VEFHTRYIAPNNNIPDNGIVENCDITAKATASNGYGTGIRQATTAAPPAGNAQTGMIFRNNIINADMYGIQMSQTAGADVYNNTIRITQLAGRYIIGIYFTASNSASNWTLNIYNNTIDKLQTVSAGAAGINLGAVAIATAQTPVTYNVYNNMICGYNFTSAANISNAYYYGIYCDSYCSTTTNPNVFLNFHHNSIYMPHFATLIYTTDANRRQRAYGLGCHAQISRARTIDFRNNNIRVEQAGAACVHPGIETTRVTRTINYNNLSADTANGAFTAFYNYAADYSTLADWQAALYKEYDQNSVAVDPLTAQAPLTGVWTAANNLLYTSYPSSSLHALPVTGITTDIKGAARSAVHPFMGCEEWQPTGPKAQLLTDGLNFGRALIQTAGGIPNAPKSLMIRNVGTSDLIISGVSYQSGSAEFTFSSVDSPIAPGATGSCTLLYTANTLGPVSAVFQIASNDAYEPNKNFDAKGEGGLTKKFSGFPIGRGPSLIGSGPGDDYATLYAAAADFNSVAGGCTGDWDVFITSDLTEPANVAFGNNVPTSYTVTIRPLAGVTPTINFTQTTVGAVPGHWVIGSNNPADLASLVKTDNFIINGCAGDAWSTRSLTIQNLNTASIANSRLILVYGDSDNFTIKNCNLINGSRSVADNGCTGVEFTSRLEAGISYIPDYGTVDNCSINVLSGTATTGRYGTGIKQFYSGTITSGQAQRGLTVRNCEIDARYVGIFLAQTAGADIHDNTIRLDQYSVSTYIYGIYFYAFNNAPAWSLNIFNNRIDKLQTVNYGATGIDLGTMGFTVAHTPITFNVYNNMICGFNFTTATPVSNVYYRGIYCDAYYNGNNNRDVFINICHNSIYMPHFANLTWTDNTTGWPRVQGIGFPTRTGNSRTIDVRNNNIRVEQNFAACLHPGISTAYATRTINYNNLSADTANGALTVRYNNTATVYPALADWQADLGREYDQNSMAINPFTAQNPPDITGVWTAADNLLYTSYPTPNLHALPVAGITTDIKGAPRSATQPFMGCEEWQPSGPKICLLTGNLDFGKALIQTAGGIPNAPKALIIKNVGTETLTISGVTYQSGSAEFAFDSVDTTLAPGATGSCTLLYTANTLGPVSATFQIASNDAYEPNKNFDAVGEGGLTKKFSGFPIGRGPSLIGSNPGDDYPTLYAAALDFNSVSGGCTGDWDVFITSDLTEPANVAFGNNVPTTCTVTIRPLAGVEPTINFTQTTVGLVPGHWNIGATNPADLASLVKTDNFIINGCADDAWSTRSMTIKNLDTVSITNSRLILVYGDSDNFTIKNCNLINGSRYTGDNGCTGVEFMSRNDTVSDYIPDYGTVDNCLINALSGTAATGRYGTGVKQYNLGTISVGQAQRGLTVSNCDINVRYIGVFMAQTAGADIHDNRIRVDQYSASTYIYGIYFQTSRSATDWSMNIYNNTIDQLQTVNYGATGIFLNTETYATTPDTPIYFNVFNNMICGFNFTVGSL